MTDTTRHRDAARPPPGAYPVPGAIGPMASVEVTVLDLPPEEVDADKVELRLVAFLEKLRASERDRRLERPRTDGGGDVPRLDRPERTAPDAGARDAPPVDDDGPDAVDCGEDGDGLARLLEEEDVFARLEGEVGRRPLLTPKDSSRIKRRAKACADRRNAIVNDALAGPCRNSGETERVRKRLLRLAGPVPAAVVRDGTQADAIAAELHGAMPWVGPATESAWHALRRPARCGTPVRVGPPGIGG